MPYSKEYVRGIVANSWQRKEDQLGFTSPLAVGAEIKSSLPFEASQSKIVRAFERMDFAPHVYDGAQEVVGELLKSGDSVVIWTQGDPRTQLFKVATSGLSELRKDLPREDRARFSVHARLDKISQAGELIHELIANGADAVVVVDDKAKNVAKVAEAVLPEDAAKVMPVWINQGRSANVVPEGYTYESFQAKFKTIKEITDVRGVRDSIVGAETQKKPNIVWLLDFDHTLANSSAAREDAFQKLSNDLVTHQIVDQLPPISIEGARLNGNVRSAEALPTGMSGGLVVKIDTDDWSCVVKHNPVFPEKVRREQAGYEMLRESPLAKRMLTPVYTSREDAVHVLPYFDGVQMRDGVKRGLISDADVANVIRELLAIKREWWAGQEKQSSDSGFVSMQRSEWGDTKERIMDAVHAVSKSTGISPEQIWTLPIDYQGQRYPSLISSLGKVSDLFKNAPPYTVAAHGDATGGNILINPETKDWKLVDAEWSGPNDPAEAFVRMTKYISTTTLPEGESDFVLSPDALILRSNVSIPPIATSIRNYAGFMEHSFARSLGDADFSDRVKTYMAGSYLREVALSKQRDKTHLAPFAIFSAAQALSS